jgi:nitronate monooxygenase
MKRRRFLAIAAAVAAIEARASDPARNWYEAALAMKRLAESWGDQPYGAVLVLEGTLVGEGPSRVVKDRDNDAHAERVAIRDAQRRLGRTSLAGTILYSTSRPCSACEAAAKAAASRACTTENRWSMRVRRGDGVEFSGHEARIAARYRAAHHPGADGRRASQCACHRGVQRGRAGFAPLRHARPHAMSAELRALRAGTQRPVNFNFFCYKPPTPSAAREAAWREALAPYYREYGIDPATIPAGPGRIPFSRESWELVEEFRPAVVSFHFGLPEDHLLARVKSTGAKVLCSATTVEEARFLEAHGVDAIIAQGAEAGGHRGFFLTDDLSTQLGTLALVPQIVSAVKVPVIAAGGIADAAGVAAARAMGASGVQVGTAFLLCPEATISKVHRAALKSDAAARTALTNLFTGGPARGIVNRLMREIGPIGPAPAFPLAVSAIAPLRARAEAAGSNDFSPLWSGQNASGCREAPAASIVAALAKGLT